jgi:geranyl-CoA carboxylase alpha subunit
MLAKIVAHGANREEARRLLLRGIERTRALGLVTNKAFLSRLLTSRAFASGAVTTDFVEPWVRSEGAPDTAPLELPAIAGLVLSGVAERRTTHDVGAAAELPWALPIDDGAMAIEVRSAPPASRPGHALLVDGKPIDIALVSIDADTVVYVADGVRRSAAYAREGDSIWLEAQGVIASYRPRAGRARGRSGGDEGELRAPMAAQVVAVTVAAGDKVEKGANLVTLRAMKLEHRVAAPADGVVSEVLVREGDQVAFRQVLVRLEAAPRPADAGKAAAR